MELVTSENMPKVLRLLGQWLHERHGAEPEWSQGFVLIERAKRVAQFCTDCEVQYLASDLAFISQIMADENMRRHLTMSAEAGGMRDVLTHALTTYGERVNAKIKTRSKRRGPGLVVEVGSNTFQITIKKAEGRMP